LRKLGISSALLLPHKCGVASVITLEMLNRSTAKEFNGRRGRSANIFATSI
jgi:hypothetical protein